MHNIKSKVCDLMLLDISQARWTVSISQLQSKMCPLEGRLLRLQHFIVVSSQECACEHWDRVTVPLLMNCMIVKMANRNRGNQGTYFNKETGFFFVLIWQGGEEGKRF